MSKGARLLKAEGVRLAPRIEPPDGPAGPLTNGEANGRKGRVGRGHGRPGLQDLAPLAPDAGPAQPGGTPAGPRPLRVSEQALRSVRERARRVLSQAHQRAQELLARAREQGFEAGYRDGLEHGRRAGQDEVRARAQQILERLQQVVQEAEERRERALLQADADVVELALAVAEKVIRRQVEAGPEVTRAVLHELLGQGLAGSPARVRVRVHPEELAWLAGDGREGPGAGGGPVQVEWVGDPRIERGGCVVETDLGAIDADLTTRLERVRQALMDGLPHGAP